VLKVWDMSGKLLAGPQTLTDFFGGKQGGRFSGAFCALFIPSMHPRRACLTVMSLLRHPFCMPKSLCKETTQHWAEHSKA
jgi:hypothetical protein